MSGTTLDGTRFWQLTDYVIPSFKEEMEKTAFERFQFERFNERARKLAPNLAVELIAVPKKDPPDFRVRRAQSEFGLDLVSFAHEGHRRAAARFHDVEEQIQMALRADGICFPRFIVIQIKFLGERGRPEKLRRETLSQLVSAFAGLACSSRPQPGKSGTTSDGRVFWLVHSDGLQSLPDTEFTRISRLQLQHMFQLDVDEHEVKGLFDDLVDGHDEPQQEIEELVVIAGSPDRWGYSFPSESALAQDFFANARVRIRPPKNIRRVILDNWGSPKPEVIFERSTP